MPSYKREETTYHRYMAIFFCLAPDNTHGIFSQILSFLQGWTKFYEFSFGDLRAGADIIDRLCTSAGMMSRDLDHPTLPLSFIFPSRGNPFRTMASFCLSALFQDLVPYGGSLSMVCLLMLSMVVALIILLTLRCWSRTCSSTLTRLSSKDRLVKTY